MRQSVKQVMSALSAAVDQTAIVPMQSIFNISVQAVVTGASTGTLKLQASNDIIDPASTSAVPTNWTDITGATVTISAAGSFLIPKTDACYENIRVVYTHNNGSAGTISVNVKIFGA